MLGISDIADLHCSVRKFRDNVGIIISSKTKIIPVFRKELCHRTLRFVLVHRKERHHRLSRAKNQADRKQRHHCKTVKRQFLLFQIKAQYRQYKDKDRNVIPGYHRAGGKDKYEQIQHKAHLHEKCDQAAKSASVLHFPMFHRHVSIDCEHHERRHGHDSAQG